MALDRLDDFRRDLDRLRTFRCSLRQAPTEAHDEEHPTVRDCAISVVGALHHLDFQLRRRAWRVRSEANAVSRAIWEQIVFLEQEFDLAPAPYWTLDQVIAGGPGYERRWPGYSGG